LNNYRISWPIRHMIFLLEILEKNNDECILILVIYWKKTGLLHTKISNHNIIYSSQKPRKSSSLPLKSYSWLFSLDVSLASYKMSSSHPSSALLMPHFFKDFTIVSLLTRCPGIFHPLANIRNRRPFHSSCRCNVMSWRLNLLFPFLMHKSLERFIN